MAKSRSQSYGDVDGSISSAFVSHEPVDLYFPEGEGRTRQEFTDECDINNILARYARQGIDPRQAPPLTSYVDWTEIPDNLQDALQMLETAKEQFMMLPADVRREFDNDPVSFVAYASDPENIDQMREWGLAAPKKVEPLPPDPAPPDPAPPAG